MKEKVTPDSTKQEVPQKSEESPESSIQGLLEILGEEEQDLRDKLNDKLKQIQAQKSLGRGEGEPVRDLAILKEEQLKLQTAITSMQALEGCQHLIVELEARKMELDCIIQEMTKKPAEERLRSLQDKRSHREKIIKDLDKDIQEKSTVLDALKDKEREHTLDLQSIKKEINSVMKELKMNLEDQDVKKDKVLKASQKGEAAVAAGLEEEEMQVEEDEEAKGAILTGVVSMDPDALANARAKKSLEANAEGGAVKTDDAAEEGDPTWQKAKKKKGAEGPYAKK